MSETAFEVVSTFYIKEGHLAKFDESIKANKKKIDALMPKGVTFLGIYVHSFGDTFKHESRYAVKNSSLLEDLGNVLQNDEMCKYVNDFVDIKRPVTTSTLANKL